LDIWSEKGETIVANLLAMQFQGDNKTTVTVPPKYSHSRKSVYFPTTMDGKIN
jgi:hypothetical protein